MPASRSRLESRQCRSRRSARARAAAGRIVELVGEAIDLGGDVLVGVAASVGVAVAAPGFGLDDILADADAAMYQAKRAGGNRLVTVLPSQAAGDERLSAP